MVDDDGLKCFHLQAAQDDLRDPRQEGTDPPKEFELRSSRVMQPSLGETTWIRTSCAPPLAPPPTPPPLLEAALSGRLAWTIHISTGSIGLLTLVSGVCVAILLRHICKRCRANPRCRASPGREPDGDDALEGHAGVPVGSPYPWVRRERRDRTGSHDSIELQQPDSPPSLYEQFVHGINLKKQRADGFQPME